MKQGVLSQYFTGFGYKRLSATEVDPETSRGHEFQGIKAFVEILGTTRREFSTRFIHLSDRHEDGQSTQLSSLTWYDSRENDEKRSAEYRLYYPAEATLVQEYARPGDLVVIAREKSDNMVVLIAEAGSTYEQQLLYLFGISETASLRFSVEVTPERDLEYASGIILENLGIEIIDEVPDNLEQLLKKFGSAFPSTAEFSAFARNTLPGVSFKDDPDLALTSWMRHEEMLFRTLERHLVMERLKAGFGEHDAGVDQFLNFSMSVHQRRKSRAGHALENHLRYLFEQFGLPFSKGAVTENKSRPDFLFPDIAHYHDSHFPADRLTMLGVKTTCKDRWRQVLSEAQRIKQKHLLTLEPSITEDQTSEMQAKDLQLVIPLSIHATYKPAQQSWLMKVGDFIDLIRARRG